MHLCLCHCIHPVGPFHPFRPVAHLWGKWATVLQWRRVWARKKLKRNCIRRQHSTSQYAQFTGTQRITVKVYRSMLSRTDFRSAKILVTLVRKTLQKTKVLNLNWSIIKLPDPSSWQVLLLDNPTHVVQHCVNMFLKSHVLVQALLNKLKNIVPPVDYRPPYV